LDATQTLQASEAQEVRDAQEARIHLAERLLQEELFRARVREAALTGPALGDPGAGASAPEPVATPDLTPLGLELLLRLWPGPQPATRLARLDEITAAWVERAGSIERRRGRFLADFRAAHGFDRREYSPAEGRALDQGLARLDAEHAQRLRSAARQLLEEG